MRLPLGPDPRANRLERIQADLVARFGRIVRPDNKRHDPVWALVQGVIGARTKTAVSNFATDGLLEKFGTWEAVTLAPLEDITEILAKQTFPEQSARRIKACLSAIIDERGEVDLRHLSNLPTAEAMAWLETLPGVGRKIAAGVMNTSVFGRRAMVIDSHHRRIVQRMGLVPPKADTVRAYDALMPAVPEEWSAADMDEHHLLLKKLGQTYCRPSSLSCKECPLRGDCDTGKARLAKPEL